MIEQVILAEYEKIVGNGPVPKAHSVLDV